MCGGGEGMDVQKMVVGGLSTTVVLFFQLPTIPYRARSLAHSLTSLSLSHLSTPTPTQLPRLRQVDVKAEHFERAVARVESERDTWEKKAEEAQQQYQASKNELEEVSLFAPLSCRRRPE